MLADRPRLQILLDGKDVTERCDSLRFSSTDQGGFEICQLGLPSADQLSRGASIVMRLGLETAWQGRVAERGDHSQHDIASRSLGGEGLRALLRDAVYSMVYADRDLTRWQEPSYTRQVALIGGNFQLQPSRAGVDQTTLTPALIQTIQNSWAGPWTPLNESWYDAGPGNRISKLYNSLSVSEAGFMVWVERAYASDDANATTTEATANLHGSAPVSGYFTPAVARRFAFLSHLSTTTDAGVQGASYNAYWQSLAAYGPHGLTLRGSDPGGFYPSDIARHALSQCAGVSAGVIQDAIGYIAPHVVYRTSTPADQVIDDMAKLMGWTWGVWEPFGVLSSSPRLDFRAPPTDATCVVSRAECDQLDVTTRLGDLYNSCQVTYTDAAGTQGLATVSLPNPLLAEAGIGARVLQLDMGLASPGAAATFASFALLLSQVAARAGGSVTLPTSVRLAGGGSKPALLLRPGIDRLRISDLPDSGNLLDRGTSRRDVFRISRIETTVSRDGTPSSVAEIDNGANLMETLQARTAVQAQIVGSGAS